MIRKIAFALALLWSVSAHAQSVAIPSPWAVVHFEDNNGLPCVGCKLFTYTAGTTTKTPSYTDAGGGTANVNPVVMNARGEANVWLLPGSYKFVLSPPTDTDPPTDAYWTVDNIPSGIFGAIIADGATFNGNVSITGNTSIGGNMGVTGLATIGILNVSGTGNSIAGTLSVGGDFGTPGTASVGVLSVGSGAGSSFAGDLNISGALTIGGAVTMGGGLSLTGNQTITGTLGVGGILTPTGGFTAAGGLTASPRNVVTCGGSGRDTAGALTNQTPVATEVYIAEVFVPANMSVTGVAVFNGSVASGNMKVGLANSSGVNVATSISTAASGTQTYQLVPFSAPYAAVGPATYYVETFYDNNTQRANALKMGACGTAVQTGQTFATGFTTITPPTTFTADVGPAASLY